MEWSLIPLRFTLPEDATFEEEGEEEFIRPSRASSLQAVIFKLLMLGGCCCRIQSSSEVGSSQEAPKLSCPSEARRQTCKEYVAPTSDMFSAGVGLWGGGAEACTCG